MRAAPRTTILPGIFRLFVFGDVSGFDMVFIEVTPDDVVEDDDAEDGKSYRPLVSLSSMRLFNLS